ncbi:MAG TPA: LON peptidase substrate-binding domain-containing protein, partial [Thermoanaerobaculia bacterium]|nr:LON peptidase substrate-binding domain-containing protein [Thermoanaerobaculia bacterium]
MTNPGPFDPAAPPRALLPLVPLRDMVVFPRMMAPFVVGRASSIAALEEGLGAPEKKIFLAAQKDPKVDEPQAGDIHEMGVVAVVVQSLKLPNGHVKVMVEGVSRGLIRSVAPAAGHLAVAVEPVEPRVAPASDVAPYLQKVLAVFEQYAKLSHHLAFEGLVSSLKTDDPDAFADVLAGHLPTSIPTPDKQTLLETVNPLERLQKLQDLLEIEIEKINIDRRINSKVKKQMERAQKEYYLNEKIKAIHQELGKKDDKSDEIEELKAKIEKAGMPKETKEKALQELKRLEAMPNVSAEATVSRNYIDWLV